MVPRSTVSLININMTSAYSGTEGKLIDAENITECTKHYKNTC